MVKKVFVDQRSTKEKNTRPGGGRGLKSNKLDLKTYIEDVIDENGGGGGGGTTTYSSILSPQLFNPDAASVTSGTDDYTLSGTGAIAFVTLNGQVLHSNEYSLSESVITITPDVGFPSTSTEVLVFQHTFSITATDDTVFAYAPKNENYTLNADDYTIDVFTTGITITLPTAVGLAGKIFNISNSNGGTTTVNTTSSQTIYAPGGAVTSFVLSDGESITVQSTGTNWRLI